MSSEHISYLPIAIQLEQIPIAVHVGGITKMFRHIVIPQWWLLNDALRTIAKKELGIPGDVTDIRTV